MIPGGAHALMLGGDPCEVYQIGHSVRFNAADTAYLSRTPAAGAATQWTLSFWCKRATLGVLQKVFTVGTDNSGANQFSVGFDASDKLSVYWRDAGGAVLMHKVTARVFRDPAAWSHVVIVFDGGNATAEDRNQVWVNGIRETSFSSSVNFTGVSYPWWNASALAHLIGRYGGTADAFGGYLAEIHNVVDQVPSATDFGFFCPSTGQWRPKSYAGTYGSNGFYLDFIDGSAATAAALGADRSGNGNSWTPTNISVTPGTGCDWLEDTTSNNFCTLNPISKTSSILMIEDGGLRANNGSTYQWDQVSGTMRIPSRGKWKFEFIEWGGIGASDYSVVGVGPNGKSGILSGVTPSVAYNDLNGHVYKDGVQISVAPVGVVAGDIIEFLIDAEANTVEVKKNGTTTIATATGVDFSANELFPVWSGYAHSAYFNFGQRGFGASSPTYKSLCTKNLQVPSIKLPKKHFDTKLHTSTGVGTVDVTGALFSPDLVWAKTRNDSYNNVLVDRVRGVNAPLSSNLTSAETVNDTVSAFLSDGFTAAGTDNDNYSLNCAVGGARTYADWLWKAGGAPVANNAGSIASQVSANVAAGFSIATYSGNDTAGATVGHGLGVVPAMIIAKPRNNGVNNWLVYHKDQNAAPASGALLLNATSAFSAGNYWNGTLPAASVFTVGNGVDGSNAAGLNYVAYCFAEVPGYSRFGKYTGNGSADGPFVHCGFRPAFVLFKRIDVADNWALHDAVRDPYNVASRYLNPNATAAEFTQPAVDFTASGFKIRNTGTGENASGGTYVFAAFAEFPFKYANAR